MKVSDLLLPLGVSTDMSSSSCIVVAVASEALSFLVCVLFFFMDDDWSLSSDFFFFRSGDSCVCVRDGLRRGCGVLFLPFVIVVLVGVVGAFKSLGNGVSTILIGFASGVGACRGECSVGVRRRCVSVMGIQWYCVSSRVQC